MKIRKDNVAGRALKVVQCRVHSFYTFKTMVIYFLFPGQDRLECSGHNNLDCIFKIFVQTSPPHLDPLPLFPRASTCGPFEGCPGATEAISFSKLSCAEGGGSWLRLGQLCSIICRSKTVGFNPRWYPCMFFPLFWPTLFTSLLVSPESSSSMKYLHRNLPLTRGSWGS